MITNIDENFGALRDETAGAGSRGQHHPHLYERQRPDRGPGEPAAEMYNAGMRGLKGSPYDGGHRVPFLVRWPAGGVSTARTIEQLTSYVDFMPTIA